MAKTKKPFMVRQGDVLLMECPIPKTAKRLKIDGRLVLAYGEVTGHAHAIEDADTFEAYEDNKGVMYIRIKEPTLLTHEEHGPVELPAREYKRIIQEQFVPKTQRRSQVID